MRPGALPPVDLRAVCLVATMPPQVGLKRMDDPARGNLLPEVLAARQRTQHAATFHSRAGVPPRKELPGPDTAGFAGLDAYCQLMRCGAAAWES